MPIAARLGGSARRHAEPRAACCRASVPAIVTRQLVTHRPSRPQRGREACPCPCPCPRAPWPGPHTLAQLRPPLPADLDRRPSSVHRSNGHRPSTVDHRPSPRGPASSPPSGQVRRSAHRTRTARPRACTPASPHALRCSRAVCTAHEPHRLRHNLASHRPRALAVDPACPCPPSPPARTSPVSPPPSPPTCPHPRPV